MQFIPPGRSPTQSSQPPIPTSPILDSRELTRQVAEWDDAMDSIDKKQEQLLNDQWKLLRTQIGSLMGALAEMKNEVEHLKENVLSKDVETVIEKMIAAHDEHGKNHGVMTERIASLEEFMGIKEGKDDSHKTNVETRLEYLEGLIGDSSDKHAEELAKATMKLDDLHAAISTCSKTEHHNSLQERLEYLEKCIGESADAHDRDIADHKNTHQEHVATMETRLEYIENLLGDSADRHTKDVAGLQTALRSCALSDHHSSLQQRVDYLEKFLDESADKHDKEFEMHRNGYLDHKKTLESRLERIEGLNGILHGKTEQHATNHDSLGQRVSFLERCLGESSEKHDNHKTTMESRLGYLEAVLGDSADKHSKEISSLQAKHLDLHAALNTCARSDHHASLESRLNFLEQLIGDSADKHTKVNGELSEMKAVIASCAKVTLHKTLEKRLQDIETKVPSLEQQVERIKAEKQELEDQHNDHLKKFSTLETRSLQTMDRHSKDMQSHSSKVQDIADALKQCGKAEHHATLDKRVAYLEKCLGESADNHQNHKVSIETRLEYIESLIGDTAEKHTKELSSARDRLKDLHSAVQSCAKSEHHSSLERRLEFVEKELGDSADKHDRAMRDVLHTHSKISGDCSTYDQRHASVEQRMDALERKAAEKDDMHGRKLTSLESNHNKTRMLCDELNSLFRGERELRDSINSNMDERLMPLEKLVEDVIERQARESEVSQCKLRDVLQKLDQSKASMDSHKSVTEQRLQCIENAVADSASSKVVEFSREMELRFVSLQEDQKRARDVLESSLMEQIRLEHTARDGQTLQLKEMWEREMKSRQAYLDNHQELIEQERQSRESAEQHLLARFHQCEQHISSENHRMWLAIDGHTHEGFDVVRETHEPHIAPTVVVQQAPRVVHEVIRQPSYALLGQPHVASTSAAPLATTIATVVPSVGTTRVAASSSTHQLPIMHTETHHAQRASLPASLGQTTSSHMPHAKPGTHLGGHERATTATSRKHSPDASHQPRTSRDTLRSARRSPSQHRM